MLNIFYGRVIVKYSSLPLGFSSELLVPGWCTKTIGMLVNSFFFFRLGINLVKCIFLKHS